MKQWMKRWSHPSTCKNGKFISENIVESVEEIANPGRGWYQIYTYFADVEFLPEEAVWCLREQEKLVLIILDISAYRKMEISEAGIHNIRQILEWFSQQGKDVILRCVYDTQGKGMEREPSTFARVEMHWKQLMELLATLTYPVYIYQGLLVGSWGEMHSSRYLQRDKLKILEEVCSKKSGIQYCAVRSPMLWRWLRDSHACEQDSKARLGIFNDGMLGSDTDLGTFGYEVSNQENWLRPWCSQDELDFVGEIGNHVPMGGEVVYPENGLAEVEKAQNLKTQVEYLRRWKVTYLNCVHDSRLLDEWKQEKWMSQDIWNGCSVYDYVGRHLGYRLVIRNADFTWKKGKGSFSFVIENVGFAGNYEEIEICLIGRDKEITIASGVKLLSGEKRTFSYMTDMVQGEYYLQAKRMRDKSIVCFANKSENREAILIGTFT